MSAQKKNPDSIGSRNDYAPSTTPTNGVINGSAMSSRWITDIRLADTNHDDHRRSRNHDGASEKSVT